jgi:hypothetical protein
MNQNINISLKPLTTPTHFRYGTWDVEASGWWNLEVIGCYDGDDYYYFTKPEDFLNHILQWKYRHWRWFAHFGGRYDMNFIFDMLRKRPDWRVSFYCSGSMVLGMDIRKGDCHIKLCDSFRLLPASLRELTVAFDVKHQKTNYDFSDMHFCRELLEYNEQDCRGLYEVISIFFEQTGMMSETFASHSLRVWRKDFLKEPIWKPHQAVTDFVRHAYHGGRTEVFQRSHDNLKCYDVNSMYPFVMQTALPVQYIAESRTLRDKDYGFVYADVTVPEIYMPMLPIRREKLFFPIGRMKAVWTVEELLHAEALGCRINRVFKAVYFRTSEVFKEFIGKLYQTKKEADEPARTIAKYLMNSFYGKFGQSPLKKVYVTEVAAPAHAIPIINPQNGRPTGFAYYERTSNAAHLLPHLSAAVTSKARLHLLSQLTSNVFYCDTDSVFTPDELPVSKECGSWSLVGEGACHFYQPKLYKFKGVWKSKGLNKEQSIDDYVNGDINRVIRRKSVKEALRDGTEACMDVTIEKRLRESRPKRSWINEQHTRPWTMMELEKLK